MSPAIGVVGFPRSGSSLLMEIIDALGIPPVAGSGRGSYEIPESLPDYLKSAGAADLCGRAIKLLDIAEVVHPRDWPDAEWRFIWSDRDPRQQALSTSKFLVAAGALDRPLDARSIRTFMASYRNSRPHLLAQIQTRGPLLVTSFEAVLTDPLTEVTRIAGFIGAPSANAGYAAGLVEMRSAKCASDLRTEIRRTS